MMSCRPEFVEMLYWQNDESWFVFDPSYEHHYRLTDKAPERARKAYTDWIEYRNTHE